MNDPSRFLTSFAQAISTMTLYTDGHPARERAIDGSYALLRLLQESDPVPQFSFLGPEVIYGREALRDLKDWDWGTRLANAGVQRMEFEADVAREDYEEFLEEIMARLTLQAINTTESRPGRRASIKFGAIGVRGDAGIIRDAQMLPTATISYSLNEEVETIRWMHAEVAADMQLPLMEAEAVVRSLSVAMHGDDQIVIPLLNLKEFDEYTTTHSLNVSVLAMALAEFLEMGGRDVRAFGVAGLLHDLGKVRIPKDILTKPGKLSDEERSVMQAHPVDGARIILEGKQRLDLAAAVAYEHHIMLNGGGYPGVHFQRDCHYGSKIVHVCDVYDALRTNRPYRAAWESDRALSYIDGRGGTEFDPDIAKAFGAMLRKWDTRVARMSDEHAGLPGPASQAPTEVPPASATSGESGGPASTDAPAGGAAQ